MNEGEEGRVGILMRADCALACLLLVASTALTEAAMQDCCLVSCVDALASAGVSGASVPTIFAGGNLEVNEETASSRVDCAFVDLLDLTCRVGDGVSVSWISTSSGKAGAGVRAHSRISLLPPVLRSAVVPELMGISSTCLRGVQGSSQSGVRDGHIMGRRGKVE